MRRTLSIVIFLVGFQPWLNAQELPLILDHPGNFEILGRTDYTMPGFGFTKAEMSANLQKITELVDVMRKNPVLTEMKGFDGRARIYTISMKDEQSYGVPSRISFEFASWYRMKDGREVRGLIEPPEWSVYINAMQPGWSSGFSRKPDFFAVPQKKKTIEPGIDLYDGECYVVYKPGQPDYWLPVTVKEAFDVAFAENRKVPDKIQRDYVMEYLNAEWEAIPEEDRNKPATLSGMVSKVGTDPEFPPIMKVNPLYWDKNLPKSAIQFIYFRMINNRPFLKSNTAEYLRNNSISYHLARFEESLDMTMVRSLAPLIGK